MNLRAGHYNAARPLWQGIIRQDGFPVYSCSHLNHSQNSAKRCAREALKVISNGGELPAGWREW